jgi:hypothetical protein
MVLGVGRAVRCENESGSEEIKTMTHGADAAVRGGAAEGNQELQEASGGDDLGGGTTLRQRCMAASAGSAREGLNWFCASVIIRHSHGFEFLGSGLRKYCWW